MEGAIHGSPFLDLSAASRIEARPYRHLRILTPFGIEDPGVAGVSVPKTMIFTV